MNLKRLIRNFFGFSRVETNGFLLLVPLILVLLFSEPLYRRWRAGQPKSYSTEATQLDSLLAAWDKEIHVIDTQKTQRTYFRFNPNTASKDELIELGFNGMLAARIVNYRAKGGTFWVKKDLKKIYGMDTLLVNELLPFIELPETKQRASEKPSYTRTPVQKPVTTTFDLNTADTAQLKSIYGIGEKLSLRIVKYRESLGGFVHIQQLNEVFGLDSTVVKRLLQKTFIANAFVPTKINLNTATEEELEKHPYLNRKEAKSIIAYRFQHGGFKSIDQLKDLHLLDPTSVVKVSPYLSIE